MTNARRMAKDDERGASLVLAIVFMVVVGGIVGGTLAMVSSGLKNRVKLDEARDREYAADAAIEYAIAQVRTTGASGPGLSSCGTPLTYTPEAGNTMRVDCTNVPTLTFGGLLQRNVVFNACVASLGAPCNDANSVIRAQVNFETTGGGTSVVTTRTWVQSWSVNK